MAEQIGCLYLVFDVTHFEQIPQFIKQADSLINGTNVFVNNAGISLHEEKSVTFHSCNLINKSRPI